MLNRTTASLAVKCKFFKRDTFTTVIFADHVVGSVGKVMPFVRVKV